MSRNKKNNKRNSTATEELRSGFEFQINKILNHNKTEHKYEHFYESESYEIHIPKKYTPDFILEYSDGRKKVIECKGYFPDEDRKKCLAFKNQYPEVDYLIIFQRNNNLYSGSKIRYGDWCDKHGIRWAVGEVPEDFLL